QSPTIDTRFAPVKPKFHLISTFDSSELTLPPFVGPSQTNEPPIPGPSPSSKPHQDILTSHPTPLHSVIIIDNTPIGSPLPPSDPGTPPPPPLIPTMRLTRNLATYDQP
ncbi:hypothetical protein O181_112016, partial [Austropuccinia psidii MF-1]|nr:hypothetical protein [Austropuccinia psidii MF-1]